MNQTLAEQMAGYSDSLRFQDLPAAVVREVKRRLIDSFGCSLGAWNAGPCVIARRLALHSSAEPGGAVLGTRHRAPADWAAFANGCLVRYLDYNDTYLSKEPAHPSDNIPAALAVADAGKASGRDLIVAIALAYEVQCRFCDAASLRARGWDHVTYGAFSTALAASRLMRLDASRVRHALGIAGVAGTALRQARVGELSHWKGCAFANAARHGVFSALLAREGMTGPEPIFEGEKGFEKLVSGPLETRVGDWGNGRNGDFMILKTAIKRWPAEYHSQSAIEAALRIRRQIVPDPAPTTGIDPSAEIESVSIQSHDAAVDIIGSEPEKWRPSSRETADHSLPYVVAIALADGEVTRNQFAPERIAAMAGSGQTGPSTLLQRVKVERNRELSALYPGAVGNVVTVRLRDGRTLTERVDHPQGHAKNPLADAEVEEKFMSLASPLLDRDQIESLLHWLWHLDDQTDLGALWPLIEVKE